MIGPLCPHQSFPEDVAVEEPAQQARMATTLSNEISLSNSQIEQSNTRVTRRVKVHEGQAH